METNQVSIQALLHEAYINLSPVSDTALLDAEILLSHVLNVSRSYLHTWPEHSVDAAKQKLFFQFISQRKVGMPVAYLTGWQEFWSLSLQVTPDTLIPRPETELLVELALTLLPNNTNTCIADLGTGSGAVAVALAHERSHWQIYATDCSEAALSVASANAKQLQVKNIHFMLSDWCVELPKHFFHGIVSNPPYIAVNDPHLAHLKNEPQHALIAGDDGLEAIRFIIKQAKTYLLPGGWLLLEHGYNQRQDVIKLLQQQGYSDIKNYLDLAGQPRVTVSRLLK